MISPRRSKESLKTSIQLLCKKNFKTVFLLKKNKNRKVFKNIYLVVYILFITKCIFLFHQNRFFLNTLKSTKSICINNFDFEIVSLITFDYFQKRFPAEKVVVCIGGSYRFLEIKQAEK